MNGVPLVAISFSTFFFSSKKNLMYACNGMEWKGVRRVCCRGVGLLSGFLYFLDRLF